MMHNIFRKLTMLGAATFVAAGTAYAQSTTQGAIAGTVFDNTNAAIPNATITIVNNATNAQIKLISDSTGFYKAPQLNPGTYTVTMSAPGFNSLQAKDVVVEVNVSTEFDPHLATGGGAQIVEVSAALPVLNFDDATYGGHLENQEIESIPINNRRWSALALLTPGATPNSDGFGLISFHAISPLLNNVQIDGADDNQAFFSEERGRTRAGYSTSQAAVREFQVNSGTYSAEYGRAVGAVINSVTKQGGNQIHGEAYFYNRNSSRSAFGPGVTNTTLVNGAYVTAPYRPKDNRNQFGFQIGGALIPNRLFWSYSFDMYRRNFPGTSKASVPGSFFVNATTGAPANGGTCQASGVVTTVGTSAPSTADNAACLLAQRVYSGSYANGATNYNAGILNLLGDLGSVPRFGDQEINTPRVDYQLTDKHHVSVLYHRLRWDSPGGVQTQATNNYAVDTFGTDFVKLDYGVVELESQLTSKLGNELRFQYGRELNDEGQQPLSAYTKSNLVGTNGVIPEVALNTSVGFFLGSPYYSYRIAYPDERKTQIGDTASYLLGRHNLRFGGDVVHNNDLQNNLFESNGFYNYTSTVNYLSDILSKGKTCDSAGSTTGAFPCYSSYAQSFGQPVLTVTTTDYGFFVQDDWKFSSRLTMNLGVRYDYEVLPGLFASNSLAPQTQILPSDKNNIAPRVGLAWDPFGQGKTTVHLGYGIFYGRLFNALLLGALENTGAGISSTGGASGSTSQALYNFSSTTSGAPTLPNTATTLPPAGAIGPSIEYLDSHLQNPYTQQFSAAVQQDLGASTIFSLSYFGALGRELPNYLNLDLNPAKTYTISYKVAAPSGTTSCGPIACGTVIPVKVYANRQQTGTTAGTYNYSPLQNPLYNGITSVISNINSSYHAMTAELQRRVGKYATFDMNYTWAHAQDFNQTSGTTFSAGTNNWFDPYANARANYSNSALNTPNRVVAWAVLTAPGTKGNDWLSYLTNGWSINPLVQFQTGLPYSVLVSGSAPNQCNTNTVVQADNSVGCFEEGSSGLAGTGVTYIPLLGRNTATYPSTVNTDLRVTKAFKFGERYNLQLLAEGFNIANHRNITGINTTAYSITSAVGASPAATTSQLVYSPSFGSVTAANSNASYQTRQIQIAAKLVF
jgi:hypothetical protein